MIENDAMFVFKSVLVHRVTFDLPVLGREFNCSPASGRFFDKDEITGRVFCSDNRRNIGFYDPGFFVRDFFKCITEQSHVIKRDIGNDRNQGCYDVRGIKAPAKADFDYRDINFLIREILEGHGHGHFEEGGFNPGKEGFVLFYKINHVFFGHHFPVYLDAFAKIL